MAIVRVELRPDRLSRRRGNRLLRVSHFEKPIVRDASETIVATVDDTRIAAEEEAKLAAEIRREVDLTRALAEERSGSSALSSPHTRATIAASPQVVAAPPRPLQVDQTNVATPGMTTPDSTQRKVSKPETHKTGESRLDLITGEWTLYASTRSQRPDQYAHVTAKIDKVIDCPFCAGQENRTPHSVWSGKLDEDSQKRDDKTGHADADWSVRVVPNLYPAVTDCDLGRSIATIHGGTKNEPLPRSVRRYRSVETARFESVTYGPHCDAIHRESLVRHWEMTPSQLFPHEPAAGGHEVIIESPRHTESFSELNTAEISLVFAAYADRIRYWQNVPGIHHVCVFKNVGRDAGASLQHSHSQLIATNRVPAVVQQVTRRMQAHFARMGSCLQCDLVRGEIEQKTRVISQTDSFVAYCPYASRFPLQVRVTSKEHLACFGEIRPTHLPEVSRLVLRIVRWLEAMRPGTAYNVLLHTCPVHFKGARDSQHWAIDIFPRMSRLAGFELATGAMINPIFPETAAKAYREQARQSDPRYVLR